MYTMLWTQNNLTILLVDFTPHKGQLEPPEDLSPTADILIEDQLRPPLNMVTIDRLSPVFFVVSLYIFSVLHWIMK